MTIYAISEFSHCVFILFYSLFRPLGEPEMPGVGGILTGCGLTLPTPEKNHIRPKKKSHKKQKKTLLNLHF